MDIKEMELTFSGKTNSQSADMFFEELSQLELAHVGGGIADTIPH